MKNNSLTLSFAVEESPEKVFDALTNVRGWWSEEIKGGTAKVNDEFDYRYQDVHHCKVKVTEVVPDKKVVWEILDNYFSFTQDQHEWVGDRIIFDIVPNGKQTELHFVHDGLVPDYECYNACVNGWTQYITHSLPELIKTGKGKPNSKETAYTTHEVAARFNALAKKEKWFDIHDELFSDDVKSIEPAGSPYMKNAEGKEAVRKKGEGFVGKIEAVNRVSTTEPVVAGNHFAVGREMDLTLKGNERVVINEIMLYEVKDGKIISEQFFY